MRGKWYLALALVVMVYAYMCKTSIDILHAVSDQVVQLGFILVILFPAICALPLLGGFIEMVKERDQRERVPSDAEIVARLNSLSEDTKKRIAEPLRKILREELAG